MQLVLQLIAARSDAPSFHVHMSYLEIYNEKVFDLLQPKEMDLPIRETADHEIVIPGLAEVRVVVGGGAWGVRG